MSLSSNVIPMPTVTCSQCGRENTIGRWFCFFCRQRLGVPPEGYPDFTASLQAALDENQDLHQQLRFLQEEVNRRVKPEHSPGVVAELHGKLRSAEEKAVALESHAATWVEKAKSAEHKARSAEEKLIAKTKEFEAAVQHRARSFEEKLVAKTKELEAAFGRNYQAKPDQRLKLIAGALVAIALLVGGYAIGRRGANQKVSSLTNTLTASEGQQRLIEDKLASAQRDLAATERLLKEAVAKECPGR
jgi:hypothetical protein